MRFAVNKETNSAGGAQAALQIHRDDSTTKDPRQISGVADGGM
jgi:hypothetical protein